MRGVLVSILHESPSSSIQYLRSTEYEEQIRVQMGGVLVGFSRVAEGDWMKAEQKGETEKGS